MEHAELARGKDVPEESRARLKARFDKMMRALFHEEGASLRIGLLEDPDVTGFIDEHASILDSSFERVGMSDSMRSRLKESDWIFSGMKTFHELNEAFPSLLDENGQRKSFERFLSDVRAIDETYNRNYLRAEYNYAEASAEMAARWEEIQRDGDDYNLQYRTAGDDKVRPEHAALNGVTLPPSDPFWDEYYPPNGWNCRCTVVQVLKDKYPETPRSEAYTRGRQALAKDTKGMFRFNSGKQGKTFPDYNPYTISKCRTCTRKLNLSKGMLESDLCVGCLKLRVCSDEKAYYQDSEVGDRLMISSRADTRDLELNIKTARVILKDFPESNMTIRRHYTDGRKNPEYEIDGLIADRKGVEGYKGITTGFRSGLEQGCKALVFDLDQHMGKYPVSSHKIANKIQGREDDFKTGRIIRCYIVYNGNAKIITRDDFSFGDKKKTVSEIERVLERDKG